MGHCTLITAHTFIIPIQLNLVVDSSTHVLAWPCGYLCCYAKHRLCHAPTDTVYYSASTRRRSFPKNPTDRPPLLKDCDFFAIFLESAKSLDNCLRSSAEFCFI